jgi:hypothetical protein
VAEHSLSCLNVRLISRYKFFTSILAFRNVDCRSHETLSGRASSRTATSFRPTSVLSPVHYHQQDLRGSNKHTKQSLYPRVCPRRRVYPCLGVKRGLVTQLTRRSQLPESTTVTLRDHLCDERTKSKATEQSSCQGVQQTSKCRVQ